MTMAKPRCHSCLSCIHKQLSFLTSPKESPWLIPARRHVGRRRRKIVFSASAGEGHTHSHSGLLFHSCCGGELHTHAHSNRLHRALSHFLSHVFLLTWFGNLHHRRSGAVVAIAGLCCFLTPFQFAKSVTQMVGMTVVICFSGLPLFKNAILQLCRLEVDTSVLMSMSVVGSIYLGMPGEGLLLLILFQISHLLEAKFTNRSRASLQALLDSVPDKAMVVDVNPVNMEPVMDSARVMHASKVPVGTHILVKPGQQVPLDGMVVFGSASVTVEHISGESLPILVPQTLEFSDLTCLCFRFILVAMWLPDRIMPMGFWCCGQWQRWRIPRQPKLPTLPLKPKYGIPSFVLRLTLFQMRKPTIHRWIDDVTSVWSKFALLAACIVAVVCMLLSVPFFGARGALYRSLCIVTAAAPCSLVLTPLAYVCALANASRR